MEAFGRGFALEAQERLEDTMAKNIFFIFALLLTPMSSWAQDRQDLAEVAEASVKLKRESKFLEWHIRHEIRRVLRGDSELTLADLEQLKKDAEYLTMEANDLLGLTSDRLLPLSSDDLDVISKKHKKLIGGYNMLKDTYNKVMIGGFIERQVGKIDLAYEDLTSKYNL